MIRALRIARREYLAYVRTFGFWLTLLLLPVGLSVIILAPLAVARSAPVPLIAVVDFTAHGLGGALAAAMAPGAGSPSEKPAGRLVAAPGGPFADPARAALALKPYLTGSKPLPGGGSLDAAVILRDLDGTAAADLWSRNVADPRLRDMVGERVREALRRDRLAARGVDARTLASIDALQPRIVEFSPKAARGRVSLKDRLPGFIGVAMGILLWMSVLTGAGMLLNSVIEEKSSRILEILLTSASVPEIMAGKIAGVAGVTATVLVVWLTLGGVFLAVRWPGLAADIGAILLGQGRLAYLGLFFVGGYLMFATLYVTIGAFCETAREAQTLLSPMMIVMAIPLLLITQTVSHPGAPLLSALAWIPLFTPFLMAARMASDPPLWEIAGTGALMFAVTALELWVAIPAFRTGALATGRLDPRALLRGLFRRPGRSKE